jgi:hypothetical protein
LTTTNGPGKLLGSTEVMEKYFKPKTSVMEK